jgi:hypothetical protein
LRPEYLALFISVTAIIASVYIARKNRTDAFSKEEYFKLQQIAEKIIAKLLIMDNQLGKLIIYFGMAQKAEAEKAIHLDTNQTFDKNEFERDGGEIGAFLEIYFPEVRKEWNTCSDLMGQIYSLVLLVHLDKTQQRQIKWKEKAEEFKELLKDFGNKPQEISKSIQNKLSDYRNEHF